MGVRTRKRREEGHTQENTFAPDEIAVTGHRAKIKHAKLHIRGLELEEN